MKLLETPGGGKRAGIVKESKSMFEEDIVVIISSWANFKHHSRFGSSVPKRIV